jgi:hypothetical protein
MSREQEIRQAIIAHIQKKGSCPAFESVGTDWTEGNPIFEAMLAEGVLVETIRMSPKGRRMTVIRLGEI